MRETNTDKSNTHIANGLLWVALFVFIGKLLGAAKEVAVAWRYGVSDVVDGYLFVFNLTTWPTGIWSGVLSVVLLPFASRLRYEDSNVLSRFRAELLGLSILLGLALCLVIEMGLPWLIRSTGVGLSPHVQIVALDSVAILALLPLPGVLIGLFSTWMLFKGQHANTLFEGLPALGILLAVLLLPIDGVEPLLWGTLIGFLVQLMAVIAPHFRAGEIEPPRFSWSSQQQGFFWKGLGVMMLGQAIMSLTGIVDQFFVAGLGSGSISTLGYANRLVSLVLGLGATAIGRATLPVFSRMQAELGADETRHIAIRWSGWMFFIGLSALVMGWGLAHWGVAILFERGAFTTANTTVVAEALRYGLLQLPVYFAGTVLVSLLSSHSQYRYLLAIAVLSLMVKLVGNWVLIGAYGLVGVQVATSLMYCVSTLCLLTISTRQTVPSSLP